MDDNNKVNDNNDTINNMYNDPNYTSEITRCFNTQKNNVPFSERYFLQDLFVFH